MLEKRTNTTRWLLLAGFVCLIGVDQVHAAVSVPLSGAIAGTVRGPAGAPQIGASVTLYNHLQQPLGKVLTDDHGEFKLSGFSRRLLRQDFAGRFHPRYSSDSRAARHAKHVEREP